MTERFGFYTPEQCRRMQAFAEERESRIVAYKPDEYSGRHLCFCGGPIAVQLIEEPHFINEETKEWIAGVGLCVECIRLLAQRAGLL